jgi:hypothetical protein
MPRCTRRLVSIPAVVATLLLAGAADAQQTWNFDQTTTGQAISWTSPTAVNSAAMSYETSYALDLVEVKVKYLFFNLGPFDITDQIPPEVQAGAGSYPGPAPITLVNEHIAYPEPPAAPSVAADLALGLNAGGFGFLDAANVVLGSITLDVPPFGTITAQITSVRIVGSLTIEGSQWLDIGNGLAGTLGEPVLSGDGPLAALTPLSVTVSNALPDTSMALIAGFVEVNLSFKGGTLVPSPDVLITGLPTGPAGSLTLGSTWPAGIPAGFTIYLQGWISDPVGPKGFAATNGLTGTAP